MATKVAMTGTRSGLPAPAEAGTVFDVCGLPAPPEAGTLLVVCGLPEPPEAGTGFVVAAAGLALALPATGNGEP